MCSSIMKDLADPRCSTFRSYELKAASLDLLKEQELTYRAVCIAGEVGELCEKTKKLWRDAEGDLTEERREGLKKELGDILWYLTRYANNCGFSMEEVAEANLAKLFDRRDRNALKGDGDSR